LPADRREVDLEIDAGGSQDLCIRRENGEPFPPRMIAGQCRRRIAKHPDGIGVGYCSNITAPERLEQCEAGATGDGGRIGWSQLR